MAETSIEWTDATWNPTRGCARVSPGCEHCYAERSAHRQSNPKGAYHGLTVLGKHGPRWTGRARFVPEKLAEPLRWRKPRRIFVNSMSDLFHEDITDEQIAAVFGVMAACPQHTFQVLTKRPERAMQWFEWLGSAVGHNARLGTRTSIPCDPLAGCQIQASRMVPASGRGALLRGSQTSPAWPPPNVHLGVSCEDQERYDVRAVFLLMTSAAVRWVSLEPLLGPIDLRLRPLREGRRPDLDWVVVGGESGPGARPCDVEWIREIVRQCKEAAVPVFVKQLGARIVGPQATVTLHRKGGNPLEWPKDLRVRQQASPA